MDELAPLFDSSDPDEGQWAIWTREAGAEWRRWSKYSNEFNWLRLWLINLASKDSTVDWALLAGPGPQATAMLIPAIRD